MKNDTVTLVASIGLGLVTEHLLGTISGLTLMCQISILALDKTTGEIGMGSPKPMISGRYVRVGGASVLLRTTVDKDSDLGQMLCYRGVTSRDGVV